jgi:hypothetical protein
MNLPPPFQDASGVEVDPEGRITLVNARLFGGFISLRQGQINE